jgi:DNA-binding MarR family transcriptional regulator
MLWSKAFYSTPGHLINRIARLFSRIGEERVRVLGFGVGQFPVLMSLKDREQMAQKDLVSIARIEQPTMAQMLNRMERDGLVERNPDPRDGRVTLFSLTPAARSKLPALRAVLRQGNSEALSSFSEDEVALLSSLLTRVLENLERVVEESAERNRGSR